MSGPLAQNHNFLLTSTREAGSREWLGPLSVLESLEERAVDPSGLCCSLHEQLLPWRETELKPGMRGSLCAKQGEAPIAEPGKQPQTDRQIASPFYPLHMASS